jgi:hypothetical protein
VEAFLTWLADERQVATATHKQALSALVFSYTKALQINTEWIKDLDWPRVRRRLSVVLSRDEVATQIGRFRRAPREEGLEQMLKAIIETAVEIKAIEPTELERVIVDTPVQEKAIAHPKAAWMPRFAKPSRKRFARSPNAWLGSADFGCSHWVANGLPLGRPSRFRASIFCSS